MPTGRTPGPDGTTAADAEDKAAKPARREHPFPIRTVLLGTAGMALLAFGGIGAGATLIHDPLLANGPFNWVRYGHGMMLATWMLYVGLGLIIWAWTRLGRHARAGRVGTADMVRIVLIWTLPLLVAPPLFSKDVYSYLSQGDLALHGLDPYAVGPAALPSPLSENVSWVWQNTPAPYGPLFVLLAKGVVALTGTNLITGVIGMRLVMAIGLGLLCWSLPGLARHLGGNAPVAVWLVAANPLLLVHLIGGAHNDMLMIGLMAVGVLLCLDRRHVWGIALVTLACAVKGTAALALPFLVWVWAARMPGSPKARFAKALAASLGVFLAVFAVCSLVAGVDLGWIPALQGSSTVVNWLSLPSGVGQLVWGLVWLVTGFGDVTPFVVVARILGGALLAYLVVKQWWLAREGGYEAIRRAAFAMAAVSLLAPATMPWYFSWALVLGAGFAWSTGALTAAACGSVWMLLVTYPAGGTALYDWGYLLVTLGVAALAAVSLLRPDPLNISLRTISDVPEQSLRHH
ncbi:polyprenol phosphomannose-dependent alpha 1,6 mannosyltransferase MptB [Kutzneria viridogrisea]|uniref:Integral membrane protein n=2 Tax=Kutzneria TaxID=43356 RepID=W5W4J6_9PSEU|nr:polyprenol phosphomannose-dependent alpha 1,6 mannosyltransferase MptB [Kutzneria albida]AHH95401.1 hypothetical protein KALB_2032 [Kutzneria albida DSM 43870]MBA8927240.1 alpha-1,6-mannosyltransferase [Kutzneria viridogrisea]